jgi:hypothetical protein
VPSGPGKVEQAVDEATAYYAIVQDEAGPDGATNLVRRRSTSEGPVDESLERGLRWQATSVLHEWERGGISGRELIEISEAAAQGLIDRFRAEWGEAG